MKVLLSKPQPCFTAGSGTFIHDIALLKLWLWSQGCSNWRELKAKFNDFHMDYEVELHYHRDWEHQLRESVETLPGVNHIIWHGPSSVSRGRRVTFNIKVDPEA